MFFKDHMIFWGTDFNTLNNLKIWKKCLILCCLWLSKTKFNHSKIPLWIIQKFHYDNASWFGFILVHWVGGVTIHNYVVLQLSDYYSLINRYLEWFQIFKYYSILEWCESWYIHYILQDKRSWNHTLVYKYDQYITWLIKLFFFNCIKYVKMYFMKNQKEDIFNKFNYRGATCW